MSIIICLILIALIYIWIVVRHDTRTFVVRTYDVTSPKITKETSFCVLADLHEKDYGYDNRALLYEIAELQPDFVLSAGDLITAHHNPSRCYDASTIRLLTEIAEQCPVYLGSGNHETKLRERPDRYGDYYASYERRVTEAGARVLHNEKPFAVSDDIDLAALELDLSYFSHGVQKPLSYGDVEALIGTPDRSRFTILLAHEPGRFRAYGEWGADLVLSGHLHGGVARIPYVGLISPTLQPFPFYDGGAYLRRTDPVKEDRHPEESHIHFGVRHPDGQMIYLEENLHAMVVSRGLGTHTIHVRFNNPGELVLIRLHPAAGQGAETAAKGCENGTGSQAAGI